MESDKPKFGKLDPKPAPRKKSGARVSALARIQRRTEVIAEEILTIVREILGDEDGTEAEDIRIRRNDTDNSGDETPPHGDDLPF